VTQSYFSAPEIRVHDPLTCLPVTKDRTGHINWGRPYGSYTGRKTLALFTLNICPEQGSEPWFTYKEHFSLYYQSRLKYFGFGSCSKYQLP
jgi:hypothetical protein